ncbi:MAG: DUF4491 family protein [Treponema sp.]|nr:DUF4491 family protein [Treponema sp.]
MNRDAVIVGVASLMIIGVFHPIVIKCEYYFSARVWPLFLVAGVLLEATALFTYGLHAYILALVGTACLWSVIELKEQEKRVDKGWFPKNPRRK